MHTQEIKMTAPLSTQTAPSKENSGIRKRRRRAAAGGAADDCFTCTKRGVKCDRRRPYCSQCLEVGNECSGYKTQLTWNVGVASRGKLRGLSLPIAKAPPVPREAKRQPMRPRTQSTTAIKQEYETPMISPVAQQPINIPRMAAASVPTTPYGPPPSYDYLSIPHQHQHQHQHHEHPHIQQHSWGSVSSYSGPMMQSPDVAPKYSKFPFPLITDNLPPVSSVGSDVDYMSPVSQAYSRDDMPFVHSPNMMYGGFPGDHSSSPIATSPPPGSVDEFNHASTPCPGLVYAPSEASSSVPSHVDYFDSHMQQKFMREQDQFNTHHAQQMMGYSF